MRPTSFGAFGFSAGISSSGLNHEQALKAQPQAKASDNSRGLGDDMGGRGVAGASRGQALNCPGITLTLV